MTAPIQSHLPQQPRHEPNQVSLLGVLATTTGLVLLVVATLGLMAILLLKLHFDAAITEPKSRITLPPQPTFGPRVHSDQSHQLRSLVAQQEAVLDSYGWIDEQHRLARIPIDRAMEILAEEGLATAPTDEATSEDRADAKQ